MLLFLAAVIIDGVDGELARLKLCDSRAGAQLDILTDYLAHVALFAGMIVGCYRTNGALFLLLVLLGGFGRFTTACRRARRISVDLRSTITIERLTARVFAYQLVVQIVCTISHGVALSALISFPRTAPKLRSNLASTPGG